MSTDDALRAIAAEYITRRREQSNRICTGPMICGERIPANHKQLDRINADEAVLFNEIRTRARAAGFTTAQLFAAIREESRNVI